MNLKEALNLITLLHKCPCGICKKEILRLEEKYKLNREEGRQGGTFKGLGITLKDRERAKRSDAEMQSGAPNLAEMQGDMQK
jgi:hypothetical protein